MSIVRTNQLITKDGGTITSVEEAGPVREIVSRGSTKVRKAAVTPDNVGRQGRSQWGETWGPANKTVANAERRAPRPVNDAMMTSGDQGAAAEVPEDVLEKAAQAGWAAGKVLAEEGLSQAVAEVSLRVMSDGYAVSVGGYPTRDGNGREAIQASYIDGWGTAWQVFQRAR
jgi:hypothetical protein